MILKPLPTSVHSITQQLALEVWTQLGKNSEVDNIYKWTGDFGNYIKSRYFGTFLLKADYLMT